MTYKQKQEKKQIEIRNSLFHDPGFGYFMGKLRPFAKNLDVVSLEKDDVLFNITGASVCRSIVPKSLLPARVNQHVAIIRVKAEKLNSRFLSYLVTNKSMKIWLLNMSKQNGATREALTKEQLENIVVIIPPIIKQTRFANIIENIEKQKEKAKESLEYSEELFGALVQGYFG